MRILVTGGAGFIGSNFVRRTLETKSNADITVLDSFTYAANPASLHDLPVRVVKGSITDKYLVDELVAETDLIVHFAAESHNDRSLEDPMCFVHTNIEGTVVLIDAAVKYGARFHHISTDEVFGDLPLTGGQRFTPETAYAPSSPYSASKAASDHMVRAYVRSFGLRATISNCSNNYGPFQHPEKFIPRQIIGLLHGVPPKVYGTGLNVRDWIHVDDHNDAVWKIIEAGAIGKTYLIGADGERNNLQVIAELNQFFGREADDFLFVKDRPGHDLRYAIDPSSTKALGWKPQHSFSAGLKQTIEWYRENSDWWSTSYKESESFYKKTEISSPN
ncbi:dTDP-glucose 4,6-dehydratase [Corynebacterium caspium]|uniref:dTDP-glucose 4,6-dehydratase n=1 Tax=Corynebacterium caspium TaxID=234828 RepID=UPI000375A1AD|nr:dTDP-glucose 4,6-dehydratase [Corynebacterium caspium]WKD59891.1 dTDP-glucose 4,6-dehydratase [Corynebacterium caspium DSM 44850]